MKRTLACAAACASLLAACGGDSSPDDSGVAFATIESTNQSGVTTARTVVVRDAGAWQTLWAEHKRGVSPAPPLPSVDFAQNMVIATFLGQRANLCYSVAIESIRAGGGRIAVEYREAVPPPAALCGAALSHPAHLVSVKRSDDPVDFAKRG